MLWLQNNYNFSSKEQFATAQKENNQNSQASTELILGILPAMFAEHSGLGTVFK